MQTLQRDSNSMTAISYHVQLTLARIPNPNHGRDCWNQSLLSARGHLSGDWPVRPEVGVVCSWFSTSQNLYSRTVLNPLLLWFLSLFLLLLLLLPPSSSPNLSSRRLDVYHTSTHDVAVERIYNAGLKCAALGSLKKYRT